MLSGQRLGRWAHSSRIDVCAVISNSTSELYVNQWLAETASLRECLIKMLNHTITILAICGLSAAIARAQDLAVFKLPDSSRPFLFNIRPFSDSVTSAYTTNSTHQGVEGLLTVLAKRFKTERQRGPTPTGVVAISFYDAVVCQARRNTGEGLGSPAGSPVFSTDGYVLVYPADTRILVRGRSVLLADLSEKTFDAPKTFKTYSGEEAIEKLKEMGLEPPEDMDWEKATNHASSQPDGATNGSQPIRSQNNRTSSAAGSRR